ncbi:MAG: hypothetical protein U0821_05155 [Chloroflexota bacterium]
MQLLSHVAELGRHAAVRAAWRGLSFVLGDSLEPLASLEETSMNLERSDDAYFQAFRERCMTWVYADDPRQALDHQVTIA